jgi:hypothetical protein
VLLTHIYPWTGGVGYGTGMGVARREITHMLDTKHPEYNMESPDASTIPAQMGSNKYASQQGMTAMNHRRWEVLGSSLSKQQRKSQGMIPAQMGSNQFCSQEGALSTHTHITFYGHLTRLRTHQSVHHHYAPPDNCVQA